MRSPWLARFPVGLFAIPVGLFALAGAWRRAQEFGWDGSGLVSAALALGMGQFAKMTADETHMLAARLSRR